MTPILRGIDRAIELLAVLAFIASTALILLNVLNRYLVLGVMRGLAAEYESLNPVYRGIRDFLGDWSVMADEVPGYLLVWLALLGGYLVLRTDGHIAFTLFRDKLPASIGLALSWICSLLMLGFFLVLLVESVRMIRVSGATEIETAEIAQGWFMAVVPISAALFILAIGVGFVRLWRGTEAD